MGKRNPETLINELISYISQERELYGDFLISDHFGNSQEETAKADEKDETTSESSASKVEEESTTFDAQDRFFTQGDKKEIYDQIDKCQSLAELEILCEKADLLRTDLEGTQLVFGVGNPNADLILIGEAPGAEEDRQGEPFVGKAGQLLNKILDAVNFERQDVYIANILKHRPPNNRNPKPEERKRSLPFLLRQIDLIEPKLILTLGKVSTQTLLDKNSSLSSMRGEFHTFRDKYQLLATYHPAALLRHAQWKRPTWKDVQLLRKRYDELGGQP